MFIKKSYRIRGNETRVQIKKINIDITSKKLLIIKLVLINSITVKKLMIINILYSAINNIENCPFEYSVL